MGTFKHFFRSNRGSDYQNFGSNRGSDYQICHLLLIVNFLESSCQEEEARLQNGHGLHISEMDHR